SLVERYRDLANEHLDSADTQELSNNSVLLTMQTNQSRIPIAMGMRDWLVCMVSRTELFESSCVSAESRCSLARSR
ncbi:hypothetical protein, partial [Mycolicibacterium austroafricanum]|uniref:hypothetical protein n=1 Tax=Mycolicibacterium austroafricanum TaxID=39687 RepID=UPI000D4F6C25